MSYHESQLNYIVGTNAGYQKKAQFLFLMDSDCFGIDGCCCQLTDLTLLKGENLPLTTCKRSDSVH